MAELGQTLAVARGQKRGTGPAGMEYFEILSSFGTGRRTTVVSRIDALYTGDVAGKDEAAGIVVAQRDRDWRGGIYCDPVEEEKVWTAISRVMRQDVGASKGKRNV